LSLITWVWYININIVLAVYSSFNFGKECKLPRGLVMLLWKFPSTWAV